MQNLITITQIWLLRRLCRKLVKQGYYHKTNITQYFRIMYQAAMVEFTEDNKPTLDAFLQECFDDAKEGKINVD
jgi:hypothetical protein